MAVPISSATNCLTRSALWSSNRRHEVLGVYNVHRHRLKLFNNLYGNTLAHFKDSAQHLMSPADRIQGKLKCGDVKSADKLHRKRYIVTRATLPGQG